MVQLLPIYNNFLKMKETILDFINCNNILFLLLFTAFKTVNTNVNL